MVKIQFVIRENDSIIERGNIVEALAVDHGWFQIIDDMGDKCLVPPQYTEIVEGDVSDIPDISDAPLDDFE